MRDLLRICETVCHGTHIAEGANCLQFGRQFSVIEKLYVAVQIRLYVFYCSIFSPKCQFFFGVARKFLELHGILSLSGRPCWYSNPYRSEHKKRPNHKEAVVSLFKICRTGSYLSYLLQDLRKYGLSTRGRRSCICCQAD